MKILFDYQAFYMQKFGGISNMFTQLILNFPKDVEYEVALNESDNYHLRHCGILNVPSMSCSVDNFLWNSNFKGKEILYSLLTKVAPSQTSYGRNKLTSIERLKRGEFDIFHPTFLNDYFLPYLNGKPYVLTIYDMISEKYFPSNNKQTKAKRKLVKSAAHIIAISEKTKQDVVEMLGVDPNRISVLYLAVPEVKFEPTKPLVKDKYFLFVGNRGLYKNFMPMAEALSPILKQHQDIKLVCTGIPFEKKEQESLKTLGIKDQVIHLRPSDQELRNLYTYALCFIFPSEYEGFGIPILEAYQQNCPVILNKRSCFPEIAQDAAIYFNLYNKESNLTEVVSRFLLMSDVEKDDLLKRQRRRLADFSWKKSADQLTDIYHRIMEQNATIKK